MDAKEVELRGKAIVKAMSEGEPSANLIKLLNDLKTGVKATEDLLRSTKIGVHVNRLRTHKDPAVSKLAQEVVMRWKEQVKRVGGGAAGAKAAVRANNGTSSPAPASATASPAPPSSAPASAGKKKHNVDPEKRNVKTDKVDVHVTGDPVRDNCVQLMYNGLAFMSDELPEDIIPVARDVESAAYANAAGTNEAYKTKMRSLFQNLKNKSNTSLRKDVLSGAIPPKKFVTMSHDELKSADRRAEDARLEKENMNEAMVAKPEESISKDFVCGKCKKKMVSYTQAQTRSADEPMTTFCKCLSCGNRWKFS